MSCDWVRIGGRKYTGHSRPNDTYFYDSTTIEFHSDYSNTDYGFRVEIIEVTGKCAVIDLEFSEISVMKNIERCVDAPSHKPFLRVIPNYD